MRGELSMQKNYCKNLIKSFLERKPLSKFPREFNAPEGREICTIIECRNKKTLKKAIVALNKVFGTGQYWFIRKEEDGVYRSEYSYVDESYDWCTRYSVEKYLNIMANAINDIQKRYKKHTLKVYVTLEDNFTEYFGARNFWERDFETRQAIISNHNYGDFYYYLKSCIYDDCNALRERCDLSPVSFNEKGEIIKA